MPCCEKCIIPDSFPGVTLENGLCTFCRNNESSGKVRSNRDRSQALSRILRTGRRNRPSGYDYLVPVRGDRESCYALYYVARNLKLNPLAVFFDSGFTTHCARRNVELVCRKLGVSWTIASPPSRYRRRAVIETLRLSRLTGHYLSLCSNCENNLRTVAVNEAALRKIPYILWSSTGHSGCIENQDNPAAGQETVDTPVI